MKNPLFQVISPTTALVTNSSHIICYVLEHIRGSSYNRPETDYSAGSSGNARFPRRNRSSVSSRR